MSMHPQPISPIPEDTACVARAAFPKGNVYIEMRNVLGTIYDDEDFAELFEVRGRPAIAPWRLALVTVMQFSEGLSDRQAAEAVRARIDWKYALGLKLTDPGFNFSVLSEFRSRLLEGGKERLLLEKLLEECKERGYLKVRGRQRNDSTHVLACPEQMGANRGDDALRPERCLYPGRSRLHPARAHSPHRHRKPLGYGSGGYPGLRAVLAGVRASRLLYRPEQKRSTPAPPSGGRCHERRRRSHP
jgi:transposase